MIQGAVMPCDIPINARRIFDDTLNFRIMQMQMQASRAAQEYAIYHTCGQGCPGGLPFPTLQPV